MWPGFNAVMPYGYGFPISQAPKGSPSAEEEQQAAPRKEGKRKRIPDGQPCLICEEPATGYHYSVPACHGCKTFFRRAIITGEGENFICPRRSDCDVTNENRNACRKCRLDRCFEVGMNQKAFQGVRDSRSSIVKIPVHLDGPTPSSVPPITSRADIANQLIEQLSEIESKCNELRLKDLGECGTVRGVLSQTTWLDRLNDLEDDPDTQFTGLRPATMQDVQMWNVREMRLCIEWAKSLEGFQKLDEADQMCLLKSFAMPFSILNRVFYTASDGLGRIVYSSGAYIGREPHAELYLPACKWTYDRQIDELQQPLRQLDVDQSAFALFKAVLFFNRDAHGLSTAAKTIVQDERQQIASALFQLMTSKYGIAEGSQRYSALLLRATALQSIMEDASANVCMMTVFDRFWKVNSFVKELCPAE
ncbi:CBN-NHR-1 protein [Aphelenchoides avenae]|nr:CBN-NHR-1 protein [Aphelenchus avenae]